MAKYTVRVMRRRMPLLGNKMKIKDLEHDEVTVEAPDENSALDKVVKAEYAEGDKRLRVYVEIRRDNGTGKGFGDYALMKLRDEERHEELIAEWTDKYGPPSE
jgi:hypothetical protein